jgi:3,4-dihydroxyphenylacetate 2,3-dioxygenase
MSAGLSRVVVVPHAPRLGLREKAPPFGLPLIDGMLALGTDIRRQAPKPETLIVSSTHYVSTFNWQVSVQERHNSRCVAEEAPDLIGGEPYDYRGDPGLARAMKDEIAALGLPCVACDTPHYTWDYGTWVPVHYLDPAAELRVVTVPTVLSADLDECHRVGGALQRACQKTGRNAVFVASTSFAHKLVRGPQLWPNEDRQEADRAMIEMLTAGRFAEAWAGFPDYARRVVAEMGGRVLALMLGAAMAMGAKRIDGAQFGPYGPSSGSGNASVSMRLAA